ncbi:PDZ domain containing 7, partial [Elysia marginata]
EAGLQLGDQVISANGVDLQCVANSGAVKVLSSSALLNLVVKRLHKVPEWKVAKERVLWYDVSQRRVVSTAPVSEGYSIPAQPSVLVERRLVLSVSNDSDFIGLNIRGGKEYGIGIYISRVDPGGLASSNGLRPGDQIVRVNQEDFLSITHSDAVDALRSSTHLIITFRSVGKYPVFKELYAEYTWSDTVSEKRSASAAGSVRGDRSLTGKPTVSKKGGYKKHTQRTRARESSVDLVPFSAANISNLTNAKHDSLDNLDQLEELDDGLPVNGKAYRPNDKDIMFRRSYEESWRDIDAIHDNDTRTEANSWSVDNEDSLGHFEDEVDSDAPAVDYTTFLEQNALRNRQFSKKTKPAPLASVNVAAKDEPVIIETVIEESVTSFSATAPQGEPVAPEGSRREEQDNDIDGMYAKVSDVGWRRVDSNLMRTGSSSTTSSVSGSSINGRPPSLPPPLKLSNGNGHDIGKEESDEDEVHLIASQIQTLEARKSHLGSYEINRVATSPKSPLSPDSTEKSKMGTWSSLKKKLKGSLRIKGSSSKDRKRIPSNFETSSQSSPVGSIRQKGMFEKNFGSQLLNTPVVERHNYLSGLLEDHARSLLTEDECKAVMRHLQTYQESKLLDRLVVMLLEILDKPEKKLLLVDVSTLDRVRDAILREIPGLLRVGVVFQHVVLCFSTTVRPCIQHTLNNNGYSVTVGKLFLILPTVQTWHPMTSTFLLLKRHTKASSSPHSPINNGHHEAVEYTKEDFKDLPESLEVIIQEEVSQSSETQPPIDRRDGEEMVYISKHKNFLGLELMGGRDDPDDPAIRIKDVHEGGAASDDSRLQPGVEIAQVDGHSLAGMSRQEAESTLQIAFSVKSPINMGIRIRHSRL